MRVLPQHEHNYPEGENYLMDGPQGPSNNMDIEEMFDTLVECNDVLLESAVSDVVTGFSIDVSRV